MIPALVEQYITSLLDRSTPKSEKDNLRYVLVCIRDACDKAIAKHDGKRG